MHNSLRGLRVLNTRPLEQGKALSLAIEQMQGISITCPALAIESNGERWLSVLPDLKLVEYAIFVSANAASYCFKTLIQHGIYFPSSIKVIAIGEATNIALKQYGVNVVAVPGINTSEHLLLLKELQSIVNKNILLFKGLAGRTLINDTLLMRGAKLYVCDVYQRVIPMNDTSFFNELWQNDDIDIILFTSFHAMENLFVLFKQDAHAWLCKKPCLVVSSRLAEAASTLGMQTIIVGSVTTILATLYQFRQGCFNAQ